MKLIHQKHKQYIEMWMYDLCSYFYVKYIYLIQDFISLYTCNTDKSEFK
jgi:hypothetical protein